MLLCDNNTANYMITQELKHYVITQELKYYVLLFMKS